MQEEGDGDGAGAKGRRAGQRDPHLERRRRGQARPEIGAAEGQGRRKGKEDSPAGEQYRCDEDQGLGREGTVGA